MTTIVELIRQAIYTGSSDTYVSLPGFVVDFNESLQTATIQLAIKTKSRKTDEFETITPIVDVPVILPVTSSYMLTLPIKEGDEALVVFADRCIDNWFEKSEVADAAEERIHSISDGFALIGVSSSKKAIQNYITDGLELRNSSSDQRLTMKEDGSAEYITPQQSLVSAGTVMTVEAGSGIVEIRTTSGGQIIFTVNGNTVLDLGPDSGKVTGDLWTTGELRADSNSAFNASGIAINVPNGDVWVSTIRYLEHIHQDQGSWTGPPINPEDK